MKKSWALVIAWIALAYWADDILTDIFGLLRIDLSKYFPLIIPFLPIIPVLLGAFYLVSAWYIGATIVGIAGGNVRALKTHLDKKKESLPRQHIVVTVGFFYSKPNTLALSYRTIVKHESNQKTQLDRDEVAPRKIPFSESLSPHDP